MKKPIPRGDEDADLTPFARVMRTRARPSKAIDFPGLKGTKVALVVPSDDECGAAAAATLEYLMSGLKLDEFKLSIMLERNLYEAEEQRQLLARILRDPTDVDAPFAEVDELREHLNADTRKVLMRALDAFMTEQSPETSLDEKPARLREMIAGLKADGGLSDFLTSCDFATLVSIGSALADLLPTPPSPSSSGTSSSNSPNAGTSAAP